MTFVFGDIHGYYYDAEVVLNRAIKKYNTPDQVIQVGDYGFGEWQGVTHTWRRKDKSFPIYFIDGNHENFNDLEKYIPQNNIIHQVRGSEKIIEGKKVLFCGGGTSIDRMYRKENKSWWPQEKITVQDIEKCLKCENPEVVITHECPDCVFEELPLNGKIDNIDCINDRKLLQVLMDEFKPKVWIFGHYHIKFEAELNGTKFYCCPDVGPDDYYEKHKTILKWDGDNFEYISLDKRKKKVQTYPIF